MRRPRRMLALFVAVLAVLFLAIQAIPYGHDHGAPASTKRASTADAPPVRPGR